MQAACNNNSQFYCVYLSFFPSQIVLVKEILKQCSVGRVLGIEVTFYSIFRFHILRHASLELSRSAQDQQPTRRQKTTSEVQLSFRYSVWPWPVQL